MEDLLQRYIKGEASEDEKRQIIAWIDERPEHLDEYLAQRKLYDISLWNREAGLAESAGGVANTTAASGQITPPPGGGAPQPGRTRISAAPRRRIALEFMKIAAVLLIGFFGARYFFHDAPEAARMQTVHVPAGQRARLTLADGTGVWLNSRSTLTFPDRFPDGSRQVKLDGEGYFTVSHDAHRPFTVKTATYDIRVLGTEFNVKAYGAGEWFETALLKGSVEIVAPGKAETLRLQPHEKAALCQGRLEKAPIPDYNYFKWKDGLFCFENETVETLIEKMQLYYDIRIEVRRPALLPYRYSGKFRIKDGIEHVLKVLQLKHKFTYTKDEEQNLIIIE